MTQLPTVTRVLGLPSLVHGAPFHRGQLRVEAFRLDSLGPERRPGGSTEKVRGPAVPGR